MRMSTIKGSIARLKKILEGLDSAADVMDEKADDYEQSVEKISDEAQGRLDTWRSAADYLRGGNIQDAIDELESLVSE